MHRRTASKSPAGLNHPAERFARQHGEVEKLTDTAARDLLQHWVRAPTTPQRVVLRSRIALLALDGLSTREIASQLAVSRTTVELWAKRFAEHGAVSLLHDAPGRGRHARLSSTMMLDRLRQANLLGPDNLPVSTRRAAAFLGVSATSVWRSLNRTVGRRRRERTPLADAS